MGAVLILLASLFTAVIYRGRDDEAYSPLNHFVSELGETGVSSFALVFNVGLIAGGFMLSLFMAGLGFFLKENLGYLAATVGVYTGVSCALVGFFPMNNLKRHISVAMSFFYSGLLSVALFSIFIIFDSRARLPGWLLLPSLITVVSFASFLSLPKLVDPERKWTLDPSKIVRPRFWLITSLEWAIFLSLMVWVLCAAYYLVALRW